jgi:hypothetical protein
MTSHRFKMIFRGAQTDHLFPALALKQQLEYHLLVEGIEGPWVSVICYPVMRDIPPDILRNILSSYYGPRWPLLAARSWGVTRAHIYRLAKGTRKVSRRRLALLIGFPTINSCSPGSARSSTRASSGSIWNASRAWPLRANGSMTSYPTQNNPRGLAGGRWCASATARAQNHATRDGAAAGRVGAVIIKVRA